MTFELFPLNRSSLIVMVYPKGSKSTEQTFRKNQHSFDLPAGDKVDSEESQATLPGTPATITPRFGLILTDRTDSQSQGLGAR